MFSDTVTERVTCQRVPSFLSVYFNKRQHNNWMQSSGHRMRCKTQRRCVKSHESTRWREAAHCSLLSALQYWRRNSQQNIQHETQVGRGKKKKRTSSPSMMRFQHWLHNCITPPVRQGAAVCACVCVWHKFHIWLQQ